MLPILLLFCCVGCLSAQSDQLHLSTNNPLVIQGDTLNIQVALISSHKKIQWIDFQVNGDTLIAQGDPPLLRYLVTQKPGWYEAEVRARYRIGQQRDTQTLTGRLAFESMHLRSTLSAEKMNILYLGVKNPVGAVVSGVPPHHIHLISNKPSTKIEGNNGYYRVEVKEAGEVDLTMVDTTTGRRFGSYRFRVKPIPDPVMTVGGYAGSRRSAPEMQAQLGLLPRLENFDFEAYCAVDTFVLDHIRDGQMRSIPATGGRFEGEVRRVVRDAKPGDRYIFRDIQGRCPGDTERRQWNSVTIDIKE